jgi:hypothetical protein
LEPAKENGSIRPYSAMLISNQDIIVLASDVYDGAKLRPRIAGTAICGGMIKVGAIHVTAN